MGCWYICIDIDMDTNSDMSVSIKWGILKKRGFRAPLMDFGVDTRQV